MKISRFLGKLFFHLSKYIILSISFYSSRLAMSLFNKLLISIGVKLNGTPRFISTDIKMDSFNLIEIGDRVVISSRVILLTHDYSCTTALIAIGGAPKTDISINKKIKIGNNVFIGMNSTILPGVQIGDNVIIGAGTVVRGNVPPNSVLIGNPGKVIGNIQEYGLKCKSRMSENASLFSHDKA